MEYTEIEVGYNRVCDSCNTLCVKEVIRREQKMDEVIIRYPEVVKKCYLTTWGLVCEDCWNKYWEGNEEAEGMLIKPYEVGEVVKEDWVERSMKIMSW